MVVVFVDRDYKFEKTDVIFTDKELSETVFTAEELDDSLNLAFGIVKSNFDVMNNPYIEYVAYNIEYLENSEEVIEKLELTKCSNEELLRYLKQKNIDLNWYPNPLCIKDRSKFELRGNWNSGKYSMPMISVVSCKNTTKNDNWCKPMDEILEFMKNNDFFFIH